MKKQIAAIIGMASLMEKNNPFLDSPGGANPNWESKEPPKPKGLRQFIIGGTEVWAINEKNALRKYKKLNGL